MDLLQKDFSLWFLFMHREQIELQRDFSKSCLARLYRLFLKDNPMPMLNHGFEQMTGLNLRDWIKCSFAVYGCVLKDQQLRFPRPIKLPDVNLDPRKFELFLDRASAMPSQIGAWFLNKRHGTKSKFHTLIRSVFFQYPLIRHDDSNYVAPFPSLVFQYAESSIYETIKELPRFADEFGTSFETYVRGLVEQCAETPLVWTEGALKDAAKDKSCDFIIDQGSYLILVEVKATRFSRDILTPDNISTDNSTKKIAIAALQLLSSLRDLRDGRFRGLGIDANKPAFAVIVTYGEVPFANSEWYFERYLRPPIEERAASAGALDLDSFEATPIVLQANYFEILMGLLRYRFRTLPELIQDRTLQGYGATGDWDTYLIKLWETLAPDTASLPTTNPDVESFHAMLDFQKSE